MQLVAFALMVLLSILAAVTVIAPAGALAATRVFNSTAGLYALAGLRALVGVAVTLVAPLSRAPGAVRAVGVFIVVAGILTPILGLERQRRMFAWWSSRGLGLVRVSGLIGLAFAALVAYAVAPR